MTHASAKCWGVVPAAGIGSRMQKATPKQYLQIRGVTLLEHSLRTLLASPQIERTVVALHAQDNAAQTLDVLNDARVVKVEGADQRSGSVLAGLRQLMTFASEEDWVLVHDAARPCLDLDSIDALIHAVTESGVGGILAEPMVDTVKLADVDEASEKRVKKTLDRSVLWRAQTPQMFRLGELTQALESAAAQSGVEITDEASAMELAGYPVQLVPGKPSNLKVTVPDDLALAAWYLEQRG